MVRDTRDVLDQLLGPSAVQQRLQRAPAATSSRACGRSWTRSSAGSGSLAELAATRRARDQVLQDLTELELRGLVRREFGGRYVRALDELL